MFFGGFAVQFGVHWGVLWGCVVGVWLVFCVGWVVFGVWGWGVHTLSIGIYTILV